MNGGSGDMTLAFELGALEALADPTEVFADARRWTEYVGVISEEPTYVVTNFTRKHRIRQDFFSGPRGREESLDNVKRQFGTDRHVFVGTTEEDEQLAEAAEWEYLEIEAAASAADWTLSTDEPHADEPTKSDVDESDEPDARDDWP